MVDILLNIHNHNVLTRRKKTEYIALEHNTELSCINKATEPLAHNRFIKN